jgi:hypothetical protein
MKRTTIMADEAVLDRLRVIARREGLSLAEVIRQGLELRARERPPRLSFIGAVASGEGMHDTASHIHEMQMMPLSWRDDDDH